MRSHMETLAWLRGQAESPSQSWYQLCLGLVRAARGVDGKYASALQAWNGAEDKHPLNANTVNWSKVPIAAPLFYRSATYGHVVTFVGVTKNGPMCWTNDVVGRGKVSMASPLWFISHWGQPLLGWTGDLNGFDLGLATPQPIRPQQPNTVSVGDAKKAARLDPPKNGRGVTPGCGTDVRLIEEALLSKKLLAKKYVDGHYGSQTIDAYRTWQRRLGFAGSDADGIPGKVSLQRLAEGQPWRVVA